MKKRLRKKVVVFDFDGTIVDSMEKFAKIASEVMPKHYDVDRNAAHRMYLATSGLPFFEQLETLFPGHKANAIAANEYETEKKKDYFDEKVFDDAADTLLDLKKKDVTVVISSNNFQNLVERFVNRLSISADMVLGWKKNFAKGADHFRHIMKETGCTHDEIVFVGDSIKDGERAADFGIDFIAKEGTFKGNEFKKRFPEATVIKTLSDLKRIF